MVMNLALAVKMMRTAVSEATSMGKTISIALVDENGWLVAMHRMDGAAIPTVEIARDKGWTAAVFRLPSAEIHRYGAPGMPGCGFSTHHGNARLTTIPGGLPILWEGRLIGAIGICSESPEEDVRLCQTTLEIHSFTEFEKVADV